MLIIGDSQKFLYAYYRLSLEIEFVSAFTDGFSVCFVNMYICTVNRKVHKTKDEDLCLRAWVKRTPLLAHQRKAPFDKYDNKEVKHIW